LSAPALDERILPEQASRYEVHWACEQLDPDALGVDVALDANRPRRLPASPSTIALGSLVPAGEPLAPGEHWLFAAPIAASGLIPRRDPNAPPSALAVRFQIGERPTPARVKGAVWLRRPDGTYNGRSSEHVLFDALAFGENGAPLADPCTFRVHGPVTGELGVAAPFAALALVSGDYEIEASTSAVAAVSARAITVNAELGRPK
jgi:hypothetical protein